MTLVTVKRKASWCWGSPVTVAASCLAVANRPRAFWSQPGGRGSCTHNYKSSHWTQHLYEQFDVPSYFTFLTQILLCFSQIFEKPCEIHVPVLLCMEFTERKWRLAETTGGPAGQTPELRILEGPEGETVLKHQLQRCLQFIFIICLGELHLGMSTQFSRNTCSRRDIEFI